MYCPKCNDTFEEGSRRFCPTDGSRLVSEAASAAGRRPGGIFANLIPKIEAISELDETLLKDKPQPRRQEPPPIDAPARIERPQDAYFELDDAGSDMPPAFTKPELPPELLQEQIPEDATRPMTTEEDATRPLARKVDPREIPAGHVDLHGENRFPSPALDFSPDDPERFVGRTVKGRYRVSEFLGGDESGLAYLGEDRLADDRKVLVRILIDDGVDEIMASVLSEERVSLSHFSHPNASRLIDSGEFSNGVTFLVSEYFDALSVNDILTIHGQFDTQRAGRIIRQAANALGEAHQEGIIHRDIRPENLIVDATAETEQVKLVNFGASAGEPNPENVPYKAPEVLEGRVATVSSDVYSLAAVAFEMLTGELPFTGETDRDMVDAQSEGLTRMPSRMASGLSPRVDEVFERALSFDPADRFQKAREFADSLVTALAARPEAVTKAIPAVAVVTAEPARTNTVITVDPIQTKPSASPVTHSGKDALSWKNRSPEPPVDASAGRTWTYLIGLAALIGLVALIWYVVNSGRQQEVAQQPAETNTVAPANSVAVDLPPQPRTISQPPNTNIYQSDKADMKGDLLRNFVGFTIFYPKTWSATTPQPGTPSGNRGKFLDVSSQTPDGRLKEQMLISYYPSKGTFDLDADRFPEFVKETNETLKTILPDYQMVSEGEIRVNQNWRAYEVKFQGGGVSESGERLTVWGRRIFVPAARPGTRNGFEITMLATSLTEGVTSVDDVGVKGELGGILETFEPGQNF